MIPNNILQIVKVIISDGDSQEYSQIDCNLKNHVTNAVRVRCGWHLVDGGLIHQGPKFQPCDGIKRNEYFMIQQWWLLKVSTVL